MGVRSNSNILLEAGVSNISRVLKLGAPPYDDAIKDVSQCDKRIIMDMGTGRKRKAYATQ